MPEEILVTPHPCHRLPPSPSLQQPSLWSTSFICCLPSIWLQIHQGRKKYFGLTLCIDVQWARTWCHWDCIVEGMSLRHQWLLFHSSFDYSNTWWVSFPGPYLPINDFAPTWHIDIWRARTWCSWDYRVSAEPEGMYLWHQWLLLCSSFDYSNACRASFRGPSIFVLTQHIDVQWARVWCCWCGRVYSWCGRYVSTSSMATSC